MCRHAVLEALRRVFCTGLTPGRVGAALSPDACVICSSYPTNTCSNITSSEKPFHIPDLLYLWTGSTSHPALGLLIFPSQSNKLYIILVYFLLSSRTQYQKDEHLYVLFHCIISTPSPSPTSPKNCLVHHKPSISTVC